MKEIVIYEANDGTRFDDELECYSYERTCKVRSMSNSLIMFNDSWKRIFDADENCYHVFCANESAYQLFCELCSEEGMIAPNDKTNFKPKFPSYLTYDMDDDYWGDVREKYYTAKQHYETFSNHVVEINP